MTATPTLLLIVPPEPGLLEGFSSGLIALANYASSKVPLADIRVLDFSTTRWPQVATDVQNFCSSSLGPLIVGITTTTATYQAALRVARLFKQTSPNCWIVLGGHHASPEAETILRWHEEIDYIVRGEGELAIVALLDNHKDLSKVPNLVYRNGNAIISNSTAPLLSQEELDNLPPEYKGNGLRSSPGKFGHVTYVSARGCPLSCAFCAVANEKIRAKSVDSVIRDLRFLVQSRGFTNIAIEDNFFAHSPKRTRELCSKIKILRTECSFSWDCQTRVESMRNPQIIKEMAGAGCDAVYLGVEAFNPDHLLHLKKTPNPASYLRDLHDIVLPNILSAGVRCYINLQVGLPGETAKHHKINIYNLNRLGAQAKAAGAKITIFPQLHVVYPGTAHWESLLESSPAFSLDSFEEFTAWESNHSPILGWLGKNFAHGTGGIPVGILEEIDARAPHPRSSFHIDADAVLAIDNLLDEIALIPGIEVFSYSRHLINIEG